MSEGESFATCELRKKAGKCYKCPGFDYYEIYEINKVRFCRNQILWGILHCDTLKDGNWVGRPEGWVERVQRTGGRHAPFEEPEMFIGEIMDRLGRTGRKGKKITILEVQKWGISYDDDKDDFVVRDKIDYHDLYLRLSPEVRRIIDYVKDFRKVKTHDSSRANKKWYDNKKKSKTG